MPKPRGRKPKRKVENKSVERISTTTTKSETASPPASPDVEKLMAPTPLENHSNWKLALSRIYQELQEMDEQIENETAVLEHETALFEEQQKKVEKMCIHARDLVTFDVGGMVHTFSRRLLDPYPNSLLYQLAHAENVVRDEQGYILLDRDGEIFRYILNDLRGYKLADQ